MDSSNISHRILLTPCTNARSDNDQQHTDGCEPVDFVSNELQAWNLSLDLPHSTSRILTDPAETNCTPQHCNARQASNHECSPTKFRQGVEGDAARNKTARYS